MPPEALTLVAPLSPLMALAIQVLMDLLCLLLPLLILRWMLTPGDPKAPAPTTQQKRIRLFVALVALLPFIALLLLLNLLGQRLLAIAATDPEDVLASISAVLAQKPGEPFALVSEGDALFVPFSDGRDTRLIPLPDEDHCRLAFFGGSSLVEPDYDAAFPALSARELGRLLNIPVAAINLGIPGYDSFSVRNRVQGFLLEQQPEAVLVYSGHNDYSFAFQRLLLSHYGILQGSPFLDGLLRTGYRMSRVGREQAYRYADGLDWLLLRERVIEPALTGLLGRFGLVRIPGGLIQALEVQVLAAYKRNMHAMLQACQKAGVPLVVLTPVGNLEVPPACGGLSCQRLFREGLSRPPGAERLGLLRAARDADWSNQDIRAKTSMLDWLRGWEQEGLWVFDLERALEQAGFAFGNADFIDLVHFSPAAHEQVAGLVAAFLAERGVCTVPDETPGEAEAPEEPGEPDNPGEPDTRNPPQP